MSSQITPDLPALCPRPSIMLERKPFLVAVVVALSAATGFALPPTTGAQWWSTDPNLACSAYRSLIYEVPLASGGKGYACGVTGTFVWFAAGGSWGTSIRMAAPASGAVGVQYLFFDEDGNRISLDTIAGATQASGNSVGLVIGANQPSEVRLLGASSDAPLYQKTQTGSVFGVFLWSSAATCATVNPQLLYSSMSVPGWSLSVPIDWDSTFSPLQPVGLSTRWSAVGINDATHLLSFAIYNQSAVATTYSVRVYAADGSIAAESVTPLIPGSGGPDGAGATRGFLLTDVIGTALPQGILKVTVEGGGLSSALFLQFSGSSGTTPPASPEFIPGMAGCESISTGSSRRRFTSKPQSRAVCRPLGSWPHNRQSEEAPGYSALNEPRDRPDTWPSPSVAERQATQ
jgi:hypothetical protein